MQGPRHTALGAGLRDWAESSEKNLLKPSAQEQTLHRGSGDCELGCTLDSQPPWRLEGLFYSRVSLESPTTLQKASNSPEAPSEPQTLHRILEMHGLPQSH